MEIAQLPTLNAILNSIATVLLLSGWYHIRRRNIPAHRLCMLGAVAASALFLVSYLVYQIGGTPYHYPCILQCVHLQNHYHQTIQQYHQVSIVTSQS